MAVKIGIKGTPRELVLETEVSADDITTALKAAIADNGIFALADDKGRQVLVPADKLAYLRKLDDEAFAVLSVTRGAELLRQWTRGGQPREDVKALRFLLHDDKRTLHAFVIQS